MAQKLMREMFRLSFGEEVGNAVSHGVMAVITFILLPLFAVYSYIQGGVIRAAGTSIYLMCMFFMFLTSTIYHSMSYGSPQKYVFRKLDHIAILFAIAGSYTPICMTVLWGGVGGPLLLAIWLCAAAGIILTIVKLDIPRWLTSVIYLAMGWMALFAIAPLSRVLPAAGMFWLIAGGVLYTVGGVLYAVKWPGRNNPRFGCHEIFHVFIVLGSVSHFILMYSVVAPLCPSLKHRILPAMEWPGVFSASRQGVDSRIVLCYSTDTYITYLSGGTNHAAE